MQRHEITFPSGGSACAAWHYQPGTTSHPVVVMGHGFGAIRRARLDAYAERFAGAGLGVLAFDYRHFGDSEGRPRQLLHIRRQLDDWRAAVSHARTLPGADPTRVAIWGSSYGGGHVLRVAAGDRRIAAAVAQVPFVDGLATTAATGPAAGARLTLAAVRDALRGLRGRPPYRVPLVGQPGDLAAMTTPDAEAGYRAMFPDDLDWDDEVAARVFLRVPLYRPGRRSSRIGCPLLLCVADEDALTPPGPAIRAAERAPKGELRRYPVGHFDVYDGPWFEQVVDDQVEFLTRHLAPDGHA
jgi:uncharacterized protein